jgi:hypothetical protein
MVGKKIKRRWEDGEISKQVFFGWLWTERKRS